MVTQTFTSSGTFTIPDSVTSVVVKCWGAGGGGGAGNGTSGGSGGGGGAFAQATVTVIPGTGYSYTVGTHGSGGIFGGANATNGSDTLWDAGADVLAKGGTKGAPSVVGTGGTAAASTGTTKFSGGDGGHNT